MKNLTLWINSSRKSANFFLALTTAALFLGCSARKTEHEKERVKDNSEIQTTSLESKGSVFSDVFFSLDKGIIWTKTIEENGKKTTETLEQKNSLVNKQLTRYEWWKHTTYETVITYKSVYTNKKNTGSSGLPNSVYYFAISVIALVVLAFNWRSLLKG